MTGAAQMLTARVPLAVRKPRDGRKLVLTPGGTGSGGSSASGTTLVKALARAFRWRRTMELTMVALLTALSVEAVSDLDMQDYNSILTALRGFSAA